MSTALEACAFWYLRHGETDWNAQNLSQGNVDIPLNEAGLAQAHQAASLLRNRGIATIVCSPLGRARTTAGIVAEALGLPVAIDEGLREASFGVQEGKPMTEWFTDWIAGKATPQGGEPFADLRERAVLAVNRALARTPPVVIVAHGALFRALRSAMGLEPNLRMRNGIPLFCTPGTPSWTLEPPPGSTAFM